MTLIHQVQKTDNLVNKVGTVNGTITFYHRNSYFRTVRRIFIFNIKNISVVNQNIDLFNQGSFERIKLQKNFINFSQLHTFD